MFVVESFPTAVALPVEMRAVPFDALAAVPLFTAGPRPDVAVWLALASLFEVLPRATLPPVLATATPTLPTTAVWSTTWRLPTVPEASAVCVLVVPLRLPTAVASPDCAAPAPSDAVLALPPSCACAAPAPSTVSTAPPDSESARLRTNRPLGRSCSVPVQIAKVSSRIATAAATANGVRHASARARRNGTTPTHPLGTPSSRGRERPVDEAVEMLWRACGGPPPIRSGQLAGLAPQAEAERAAASARWPPRPRARHRCGGGRPAGRGSPRRGSPRRGSPPGCR